MKPIFKTKTVVVQQKSVRAIAKKTGVGHSTISRINRGYDFTVETAKKLLKEIEACPCCGAKLTNGKPYDSSSRSPQHGG
jgi:uncharacterized protein YerC